MIQGNESALTSDTIAQSGVISTPDELRPVTMDDPSPGPDKGDTDGVEEGGVWIEI